MTPVDTDKIKRTIKRGLSHRLFRVFFTSAGSLVATAMLVTALSESYLRLFSVFPVHGRWANKTHSAQLGFVVSRRVAGVDNLGFRSGVRTGVIPDVIFVGDSHVFAAAQAPFETWVDEVGGATGLTTYNMGVPGYGLAEYPPAVDAAANLGAKQIVLVLYLDNDLESFCTRYAARPKTLALARYLEIPLQGCESPSYSELDVGTVFERSAFASFLRYHFYDGETGLARNRLGIAPDANGVDTIWMAGNDLSIRRSWALTAPSRVDLHRKDVAASFAFLKAWLRHEHRRFRGQDVNFSVMLVPSRFRVASAALLKLQKVTPEATQRAAALENALAKAVVEFCLSEGISVTDSLPYLVAAAVDGTAIYPTSLDGHPQISGYRVYAKAAIAHVTDLDQD